MSAINVRQEKGLGGPTDINMRFDFRLREVMSHVRKNMGEMIANAGSDAAKIMRELAPVDTGNLRDNIFDVKTSEGLRIEVKAEYAAHQEFGTVKQPARPFVIPGIRFARSNVREATQAKKLLS